MPTYKHILVATDFSDYSRHAAERALELAKTFEARLSIIHVVDYVPPAYVRAQSALLSATDIIERAGTYFAEWADTAGLEDAERIVVTGTSGHEIISAAKAADVDLIVVGTSGEGGMKRLLGSTTRAVMHDAPCDVLSVHRE